METIIYRVARRQKSDFLSLATSILGSAMALLWLAGDLRRSGGLGEAWSDEPFFMSVYALILLCSLITIILFIFVIPRRRAHCFLQLDNEELKSHGMGRHLRQWRWDELSAFKLQGRWIFRHILFAVPGLGRANWLTEFKAANLGLPEGPLAKIEDIYDAPLDEIAATLNEYREQALGGASGTQAPEQA